MSRVMGGWLPSARYILLMMLACARVMSASMSLRLGLGLGLGLGLAPTTSFMRVAPICAPTP